MRAEIPNYNAAMNDFRSARRKANIQSLLSWMRGESELLLSFEDVSQKIRLSGRNIPYLDEIPMDAIIGSVGRYQDFNRKFFPLHDSDAHRWTSVKIAHEQEGLPPIEVYKIGEAYFVMDGNHRVSIARQLKMDTIEAYVTEYKTRVPLHPDDDIDAIIMKVELSELLDETKLDTKYPELDFKVTVPGRYRELKEHIMVHRYYIGIEKNREISIEEAVDSWVNNIYLPVVRLIRQLGMLREFPNRTETDLYLFLKKHQSELAEGLGWDVELEQVAEDATQRFSPRFVHGLKNLWDKVRDLITPDELESGPPPGEWRVNISLPRDDKLFAAIFVALSGDEQNWQALEQAFPVARHEGAVIRALHVVPKMKKKYLQHSNEIRDRFYWRCGEEGIKGEFAVEEGQVAREVVKRAIWTDLVILHLYHPPGTAPIDRLRSGFRTILQRCPRPILAVPSVSSKLETTLLAYDGSPKAEEALYLSSYLGCCWNTKLIVLGATQNDQQQKSTLEQARRYLEGNGVEAEYLTCSGPAGSTVLEVAQERQVDLIVMGGYGASPLVNVIVSSTVDKVLRTFTKPVLICR